MSSDLPDHERLLAQGVAALRAGEQARARDLLKAAVRANPHDAQGWLWLSGALDEPALQRECLQRALAIDPQNQAARQGLALLDNNQPKPGTTPASAPPLAPASDPPAQLHLPPPVIGVPLSMLGGISLVLAWFSLRGLGAEVERRALLALALGAGPLLAFLTLYLLGVLLRLAGRSMGGYGNSRSVQAGLALAASPQALGLLLWLIQLTLIPAASFGGGSPTNGQRLAASIFGVVHGLFGLASLYLAVAGLAAAHRISLARAAASWLLAGLFVAITIATIFVSSALLIMLRGS